MGDYSDNEDDPPVYESSGDEWDESMELEKKRNRRRTSQRLSKKPRIAHVDTSDSEEEYIEKPNNGINRKTKKSPVKISATNKTTTITATATTTTTTVSPITPDKQATNSPFQHNYTTGSFVVNKKDAQQGSSTNPPCIWKIDGKALLQKFEPFEEDGKVRHRNTSVYTGWSSLDRDNYVSIHVQVYLHLGQKMIVEVDWNQLKTIVIDSD
ncbi:hypothetical protein QE152_g37394 [Popillia japonica]|uniref:Uncharacterized protein n=1 Tax=Popillia japonica TaxID=7064 RepID=A0AAW1I9W7_POPJA